MPALCVGKNWKQCKRYSNSVNTMQTILFIVVFFILGFLARKVINDPSTLVKWLNNHIIYLAMPSIILVKIPTLSFNPDMLVPAVFPWVWAIIGGGLILIVCRFFKFSKPLEGATLLLGLLGNTSFLGFPMVQALFNDEVLSYAIVYDQIGNFLMLSTLGLLIIAIYAPNKSDQKINVARIIKQVLSFPPFVALLIASLLPISSAISTIEPALILLGKTLMPMALLVIGLQFQPQLLSEHRIPLISAITLKMIACPVLAYIVLLGLDLNAGINVASAAKQATIFEAAMPCMITPGIMAIQAGLSPRYCATLLGYSTLFSFLWLPLIAVII